MQDCIFCRIIDKEIPSEVVYEDESVIAFKDIQPAAPVHVLIVPKTHVESLKDIKKDDMDIIENIHLAAVRIAKELGVYDSGFRLINNCGPDGGQTVMHLHYHLLGGKNLGPRIL